MGGTDVEDHTGNSLNNAHVGRPRRRPGRSDGKEGDDTLVTHFIFRPVQSLEVPGLGTAALADQ